MDLTKWTDAQYRHHERLACALEESLKPQNSAAELAKLSEATNRYNQLEFFVDAAEKRIMKAERELYDPLIKSLKPTVPQIPGDDMVARLPTQWYQVEGLIVAKASRSRMTGYVQSVNRTFLSNFDRDENQFVWKKSLSCAALSEPSTSQTR